MHDEHVFNAAVDWWVRLDRGDCGAEIRAEFERWRALDPAHAAAFAEVSALWGELRPVAGQAATSAAARPVRPAWRIAPALGLALAILIWIGDPLTRLQADYRTAPGETLRIDLRDGSVVHLDGGSALAVHDGPSGRRLRLLEGQAFFEVRSDPKRPFTVRAGPLTVTALGTVFDVLLHDDALEVTAIEHRIRVIRPTATGDAELTLQPGQQVAVDASGRPGAVRQADVQAVAAWRTGKLVFQDRRLADVVETLNRHHRGFIYIADDSLRERRVSGLFYTQQALAAIAGIETALGLRSTHISDYLILLHR